MSNSTAISRDELAAVVQADSPLQSASALYRAELSYVWATLRRLGTPASDLEDLCHEVFLVALERLPEFDPRRPIRPWLFGITFRVWVGKRRKLRSEDLGDPPEREAPDANPESHAAKAQERRLLAEAMVALEPERKAIFLMHDVDGHSAPDIARELKVPLNTVYSRLRLAREDLTKIVRERGVGR